MSFNCCSSYIKYGNLSVYDEKDLVVYYMGVEKCQPGHSWSGVRDHFLIHYILSGKGIFIFDGTSYHLKGGQGFLICPNMLSFYQADMEEPWEYCWVGFHGRYAESYLKDLNLEASNPVFSCSLENSLEKSIFKMIEAQNRPVGRDFILTGLLYQFFGDLASAIEYSVPNDKSQNIKQLYIQKAIDYIQKNYSRKITIEQIADFIGIDRKYMSSLFKKFLNTSPQEFLINLRMDKACVLLAQNTLSIQDIAHSVGYDDPQLFSKMFKKRKGLSPSQYRARLLGKISKN